MTPSRLTLCLSLAGAAAMSTLGGCASPQPGAPRGQVARLSPQDLARLTPPPNPKVPLGELIAWSQEKATPEAIIKRLRDTGTYYNLSPQQIVDLHQQGVAQSVIDYLVEAQEQARQATLLTQLADRDAKAAQELERERKRRSALQNQYNTWPHGFGAYGGAWGPRYGWGVGTPYYYDPFFRSWRPRW